MLVYILLVYSLLGFLWVVTSNRGSIVIATYFNCIRYGYSTKMAAMIIAQFRHESNNFQSSLYERAKNCSGMKVPKIRDNVGIVGDTNGYAVYRSYTSCVRDYFLRQRSFSMPTSFNTIGEWSVWLKTSMYYEDSLSNYTGGMEKYYTGVLAKRYRVVDAVYLYVFTTSVLFLFGYLAALVYYLFTKKHLFKWKKT